MLEHHRTAEDPSRLEPGAEERLLAAAAHLSLFMGLWVIGPIAIYFWQKERSAFVAFHAMQATLTALLMVVVSSTIGIAYLVGVLATSVVIDQLGHEDAIGIGLLLLLLVVLVVAVLPTLWGLYAAWKAYHGVCWRIPLVGRVARRLVPSPEEPAAQEPS